MIPAVGNPALPPQSTSDASTWPGHNYHFAKYSNVGYPVRGEK